MKCIQLKSALVATTAAFLFFVRLQAAQPEGEAQQNRPFSALYCFGFSWTDTGLRVCNGAMWPEFLSTNLHLTYNGANNFARPGANTSDTLNQVSSGTYKEPERALFVAWVAAGDILTAADRNFGSGAEINWTNELAWNNLLASLVRTSSNIVQQLYVKGARSVVIQNCLDLSLAPMVIRDIGGNPNQLARLKERIAKFNADLVLALDNLAGGRPDLRLFVLDIFSRENEVYSDPAGFGFTKVFPDAKSDPALIDKSPTGPARDYMFWDRLHGTSKLQGLIARWTLEALSGATENLQIHAVSSGFSIEAQRLQIGRPYTLQQASDFASGWKDQDSFSALAGTNQWVIRSEFSAQFFRLKGAAWE